MRSIEYLHTHSYRTDSPVKYFLLKINTNPLKKDEFQIVTTDGYTSLIGSFRQLSKNYIGHNSSYKINKFSNEYLIHNDSLSFFIMKAYDYYPSLEVLMKEFPEYSV